MNRNLITSGASLVAAALATMCLLSGTAGAETVKPAASSETCSAKQIEENKALVYLFDMKGDWRAAYEKMDPGYIQHNPIAKRIGDVNGVSGREEFKLLLELKEKGFGGRPPRPAGQPEEETYHFVMATCDHVMQRKKNYLPDPQNPGKFYEAFDFDLWRVKDGKLMEHWDGAKIPANPPRTMTVPVAQLIEEEKARKAAPKP